MPDRCGWVEPGLVMRTVGRHLRRGGPNEKRKIRKGFRTERLENPQLWRGISWGYLGDMYYIYIYGYDGMPESHALLQTKIMVKMVKKNGLPTTATAGDPEIPDLH